MSRTDAAMAADPRPLRTWLIVGGVVVLLVLVIAWFAPGSSDDDVPLDPNGTGPTGAKATLELARRLGATVRVSARAPADDVDVVLVGDDRIADRDRDATAEWVRRGGILVVTDPASSLNPVSPRVSPINGATVSITSTCGAIPALADADDIQPGRLLGWAIPPDVDDATSCYQTEVGPYLVTVPEGDGLVVSIGGGGVLTNAQLGKGDNAVLIGALLAPEPGTVFEYLTPLAPDVPPEVVAASDSGSEWPPRTGYVVAQALVGAAIVILWRARRLGRPVLEDPVVDLPPSELVVAVGAIDQRAGRRAEVTTRLVAQTAARLRERLGLPPDVTPDVLASVAAARLDADADHVRSLLVAPPPGDDAALVARAAGLATLAASLDPGRTARTTPARPTADQET